MKNNIQSLSISLGFIVIASLIYTLGTAAIFISLNTDLQISYLIGILCFMPLGFIVIPYFVASRIDAYSKNQDVSFSWKSYFIISVMIFIVNHYILGSDEYFHQMIISICEEFLFRFIIYKILRKNYSYAVSILISSLLFGLILHINYPMIDNLIIRTPMAVLFSILTTKFGLEYAVGAHWIYNLWQSIL